MLDFHQPRRPSQTVDLATGGGLTELTFLEAQPSPHQLFSVLTKVPHSSIRPLHQSSAALIASDRAALGLGAGFIGFQPSYSMFDMARLGSHSMVSVSLSDFIIT